MRHLFRISLYALSSAFIKVKYQKVVNLLAWLKSIFISCIINGIVSLKIMRLIIVLQFRITLRGVLVLADG